MGEKNATRPRWARLALAAAMVLGILGLAGCEGLYLEDMATYGVYAGGKVVASGESTVTGDVRSVGSGPEGFPPAVIDGKLSLPDTATAAAQDTDLRTLYSQMQEAEAELLPADLTGSELVPGAYASEDGQGFTLDGDLTVVTASDIPTDPEVPVDPVDPVDPTDPTDPGDSTDPEIPEDPDAPTDPEIPFDETTDPEVPEDPDAVPLTSGTVMGIALPLAVADGDNSTGVLVKNAGNLDILPGSSVTLGEGTVAGDVFWQVDGEVKIGAGSTFVGSILSSGTITVGDGATVQGRLFSINGDVALGDGVSVVSPQVSVEDTPTDPVDPVDPTDPDGDPGDSEEATVTTPSLPRTGLPPLPVGGMLAGLGMLGAGGAAYRHYRGKRGKS